MSRLSFLLGIELVFFLWHFPKLDIICVNVQRKDFSNLIPASTH